MLFWHLVRFPINQHPKKVRFPTILHIKKVRFPIFSSNKIPQIYLKRAGLRLLKASKSFL